MILNGLDFFNPRSTRMTLLWGRTLVNLNSWRLKRRNTGCTMTGTVNTSPSRPRPEITLSFPAFGGWWTTKRWSCEMAEVGSVCRDWSDWINPVLKNDKLKKMIHARVHFGAGFLVTEWRKYNIKFGHVQIFAQYNLFSKQIELCTTM